MLHRHKWELIDKTVLPSGWEQMDAAQNMPLDRFKTRLDIFEKKVIYIFRCAVCSKVKKIVK